MKALMLLLVFLIGCSTSNETDSDKVVNEFKKAGQKVGKGIETGVNNVRNGVCEFLNEDTNKCEDE